ncbi:hypothetical protein HYG77_35325 (plasmid) [Rhodococcus sp. ZPP]|nr:hypothetical protein HYG77_35325 [Rhodococcus sp. ZPP]
MGAVGRRAGGSVVKIKTIVVLVLFGAMVASLGVLGWQLSSRTNELNQLNGRLANEAQAEQVALDYATGAAEMDVRDLVGWRGRLTKGTTPELSDRLTQASSSMEQIITPLQWVSTATPAAAKVSSVTNGVYSVECFVNVLTKNIQAPDGIQSTATYKLTVDGNNSWAITDIGGIDSSLPPTANAPR